MLLCLDIKGASIFPYRFLNLNNVRNLAEPTQPPLNLNKLRKKWYTFKYVFEIKMCHFYFLFIIWTATFLKPTYPPKSEYYSRLENGTEKWTLPNYNIHSFNIFCDPIPLTRLYLTSKNADISGRNVIVFIFRAHHHLAHSSLLSSKLLPPPALTWLGMGTF